MSEESRAHRFAARRHFYDDLRSGVAMIPLSIPSGSSNSDALATDLSSVTRPRGTQRGSYVLKDMYVRGAGGRASLVIDLEAFIPYTRSSSFDANMWIKKLNLPTNAKARVLCIPGIGGTQSNFLKWSALMERLDIEVWVATLPGRMSRVLETEHWHVQDAAHSIHDALADLGLLNIDGALPMTLFGHSLGALIAFELAKIISMHNEHIKSEMTLIVSSCPNPVSLSAVNLDPFNIKASKLPAKALMDFCVHEGLLDGAVDPRVSSVLVPLLQRDLAVYESYFVRRNDVYSGASLEWLRVLILEVKLESGSKQSESRMSEDYLCLQRNNFEYAWDGLGCIVKGPIFFRVAAHDPFYFVHRDEVALRVVDFVLHKVDAVNAYVEEEKKLDFDSDTSYI